jgi:DNA polymerase-4
MRKIIHIDMDAFFASVEQRDNESLRGRPVAVGGVPGTRGVVAAASYEARKYGVHSAMASTTAARLCPHLIFVRPRFDVYKGVSRQIREIFHAYTDLVEPLSLDEAYLDVTENKPGIASAIQIAREIRAAIKARTQLTATAGVSFNKFLAKMASGYKKPDGLNFIPQEQAIAFIDSLQIDRFYGIGDKTAEKMKLLGLHTGADLRLADPQFLVRHFGKAGRWYHEVANALDHRAVVPWRPIKSASVEDTFLTDLVGLDELDQQIVRLTTVLMERLRKNNIYGKTITLKVKYADFRQVTRSQSFPATVTSEAAISEAAQALLRKTEAGETPIRLIGIGQSNFPGMAIQAKGGQLEFDFDGED